MKTLFPKWMEAKWIFIFHPLMYRKTNWLQRMCVVTAFSVEYHGIDSVGKQQILINMKLCSYPIFPLNDDRKMLFMLEYIFIQCIGWCEQFYFVCILCFLLVLVSFFRAISVFLLPFCIEVETTSLCSLLSFTFSLKNSQII